jgi:hypothetical protein
MLACTVATVACGANGDAPNEAAAAGADLGGWYSSIPTLVEDALARAAADDMEGLTRLRVTEREHEELLWPAFPASDPALNIPHSFAWSNLQKSCWRGQHALVSMLERGQWAVRDIEHPGGIEPYSGFRLHRDTLVQVEGPDGAQRDIHLLGSVVEIDGRFKLLSYREP